MNTNHFKNGDQRKDSEIFSSKRSEQEVLVLPPNLLQQLGINLENIENSAECFKFRDLRNESEKFNGKLDKQKFNANFENSINETEKVMALVDTVKSVEKNNFNKRTQCDKEKNDNLETTIVMGQTRDSTDIADNKVKEIASYLCQYFLPAKANNSPKRFVTKSKICIQGVEKPGGIIKVDKYKCTKTYQNKKKKFIISQKALSNNFVKKINEENHEIDLKVNDPCSHSIIKQLCVCKDFGKLQFYDNKYDYQHIHFQNQNITQSSLVTLFEIYKSDSMEAPEEFVNRTGNNQYVNSDFNQFDSLQEICYTTYLSYENSTENCVNNLMDKFRKQTTTLDYAKSIDFSDVLSANTGDNTTEMNNVTTNTSVQITEGKSTIINLNEGIQVDAIEIDNDIVCGQKRKRLLEEPLQEFWNDCDKNCTTASKHKKKEIIVRCAVCTEELSDHDWENHLRNEHCYISWKLGHYIDLNDGKLSSNLRRRLKEVGLLKCTFCGKEYRFLKKFMKHVQGCLKTTRSDDNLREEFKYLKTDSNIIVKCGVCCKEMGTSLWLDHIATKHNYKAWRSTEPPLDIYNQQQFEQHLQNILKQTGELACAHCGLICKHAKLYMQHIVSCEGNKVDCGLGEDCENDQLNNISSSEVDNESLNTLIYTGVVKCGVCHENVSGEDWLDHIHKEHNYLARIEGVIPLDINDDDAVRNHLHQIRLITGYLTCGKCGLKRKVIKKFLQHVNSCGAFSSPDNDSQINVQTITNNSLYMNDILNPNHNMKCGVCGLDVEGTKWLDHIHKNHEYLAWIEGRPPIDVSNKEEVWQYLNNLTKEIGGLICLKCGLNRKYVKAYLEHFKSCDGALKHSDGSIAVKDRGNEEESEFIYTGIVKCGVCKEEVDGEQWIDHIHSQHDYLARIEGKSPLNVNNNDEVIRHLNNLKNHVKELICNKCGETYKFGKSFMRHINNCEGIECKEECLELQDEDLSNDTNLSEPNNVCILEDSNVYQKGTVKCGVCLAEMDGAVWLNHLQTEHNYLARVEGKPLLNINDKEQVKLHLHSISKQIDGLICSKCGLSRKYAKVFLQHINNCDEKSYVASESNMSLITSDQTEEEIQLTFNGVVVCGVCKSDVDGDQWIEHILKEHNYLAHVEGNKPLDLTDEKKVQRYLNIVCKHTGGLYCAKCGLMRMYVKSYLRHISKCRNNMVPGSDTNDLDQTNDSQEILKTNDSLDNSIDISEFLYTGFAKCGVCQAEVEGEDWINHIQKEHNYLAWIDGRNSLDLENTEQVYTHLYSLSKFTNGLTCKSCGIKRKYVKSFLDHIDGCSKTMKTGVLDEDNLMECAVCLQKVEPQNWRTHSMNYHYNIAWATGMDPIDLRNPYTVERYLKDYKQVNKKLICKICNTSRVSCVGFYAHIITCGKTEEEIDFYKSHCDICNCKYLCIYKNQHIAMHRGQEFIKEKKVKLSEENEYNVNTERNSTKDRRKAALRANVVIENYKICMNNFKHKCSSCEFGTDLESELNDHSCETHSDRVSDSDVSIQFDGQSEEESDSDFDSDISLDEAEEGTNKKKRYVDFSAKVPRLLFKVNNASHYVSQGAIDFINMHYTLDVLFPQWITSEYQELDSKELPSYLPILDESCKVRIANEEWTTYKQFEAKKNKVTTSLFAGGSVRCVSWVPVAERTGSRWEAQDESGNYLAVASHAGPDAPRLRAAQTVAHPSLVQIWHFADFTRLPKFVLGIAHDYGTVWAMDWCPSGVRDHSPDKENKNSSKIRLGLLAIACSNGSAYIFVVPYPNEKNLQNSQIIKIKPSAELRLCSGGERDKYQATSICWSQQKGHSVILVGYADGTTAFYNLDCDSPLLKIIEDGVTILYPFQDDRPHNTCISGVGLFPSNGEDGGEWGAWSGASCTGAHAALRASAPRLYTPLATAGATFTPHWPSVIVTADEAIANHTTNELEWHGGGRRLGGQHALATCMRCGLGVAYVPPVLRATRTHPAFRDQRRDIVAFIHMAPLAKKRSKHVNDDLSMKVEPLVYEEAIKEYGVEFKLKTHMDKGENSEMFSESKQNFPERFPLADVTSMSFCTSPSSHGKLAVATHAGLIFIFNI